MAVGKQSVAVAGRLSELEAVVARIEGRPSVLSRGVTEIDAQLASLQRQPIDPAGVAQKPGEFEGIWEVQLPRERGQLVYSLVQRVMCSPDNQVRVMFRTLLRITKGLLGSRPIPVHRATFPAHQILTKQPG
jgi:hypothetical protein